MTAEEAIRKYVRGRGAVREWVKLRELNEALDLEVCTLAALFILGPAFVRSLPERAARAEAPGSGIGEVLQVIAPGHERRLQRAVRADLRMPDGGP